MTRPPRWRGGAERDRGEGHQGEEDRKEGSQCVKSSVRPGRDNVLLGEHLDRVGRAVKNSQQLEAEDGGAVGSNPILDEGRLLPLHPCMEPRQVQYPEKNDPN